MELWIPTKVYSEEKCLEKYGDKLAGYGKKALLVTGKNSAKKTGALADVVRALEKYGISYVLFDEVEENPSVETVMKARKTGIREQVDFVIGIGGGSPLDASKAIALMIKNPQEGAEVLYEKRSLEALPVAAVPTTCGTGSEVTPYAILTLHKERTKRSIKHRIFPAVAFLDTKYLSTLGRQGIVNTCTDALSHLIESYLNANSNEYNRLYSSYGMSMFSRYKMRLLEDELKPGDYHKMFLASMAGGMAISHTGTSLPHGLSYAVTYEYGIPHGKAVGMFIGGYVETYPDKNDVEKVLSLLGFDSAFEFRKYMTKLLGKVEAAPEILEAAADKLLKNPDKMKNYPFVISKEVMLEMAN